MNIITKQNSITPTILLILGGIMIGTYGFSQTYYVQQGASGINGTSWADAFGDLQQAIDSTDAGDTIWVAQGTYIPSHDNPASPNNTNRDVTFYINKDIKLFGGFAGVESHLSERDIKNNLTILKGAGSIDTAFHVMYIDGSMTTISNACTIDGFEIREGKANIGFPDNVGGGISINGAGGQANPSIRNCTFLENNAQSGGAIFNEGGGGICSPLFVNCLFRLNSGTFGGALYNSGFSGESSPVIINCTFTENTAPNGPAIINDGRNMGTCVPQIINSILWNNGSIQNINNDESTTILAYSLLDDGNPNGTIEGSGIVDQGNNLDADPLFNPDFSIGPNSPALNAGDNIANSETKDLNGESRIRFCTIDMGAYETLLVCPMANEPIYVSPDECQSSSWANTLSDFQDAIDLACHCPGTPEIWVAKGTYYPSEAVDITENNDNVKGLRNTFYITHNIQIYGGFAGDETQKSQRNWELNPTIFSGDYKQTSNDDFDNAWHVFFLDGTGDSIITQECILDGLIIEQGFAGAFPPVGNGAGIYNKGSGNGNECSPIIRNCLFRNNYSSNNGGGIYNNGGSNGSSNPQVLNCSFINNEANNGDGVYDDGSTGGNGSLIVNCLFIPHPFSNNPIENASNCETKVINCTFYKDDPNDPYDIDVSGLLNITNSILWNTTIDNSVGAQSIVTNCLSNNDVQNSVRTLDGGNNLDLYPNFMDTTSGNIDLRLQPTSVAINAGVNDSLSAGIDTDLSDDLRIRYDTVDIGAYEAFQCIGDTLYVDVAQTSVSPDGLAWASAFPDLESALTIVNYCDGSREVWVAAGTYCPDKALDADNSDTLEIREKTFYISKNVKLLGGFAGNENSSSNRDFITNVTILSGDLYKNDASGIAVEDLFMHPTRKENAHHILFVEPSITEPIDENCVIDGFTFQGGQADVPGFNKDKGGAVVNFAIDLHMNPIYQDCTFKLNTAIGGGAIYNVVSSGISEPTFFQCNFINNAAKEDGGVMYNKGASFGTCKPRSNLCSFESNYAERDGGVFYNLANSDGKCNSIILSSSIINNKSEGNGGALFFTTSSNNETSKPLVQFCTFSGNIATKGGVVYTENKLNPSFTHCNFLNNEALISGGVLYSKGTSSLPVCANSLFYKNKAEFDGGAIYLDNSKASVVHSTLFNNEADDGGAVYIFYSSNIVSDFMNTIFWQNGDSEFHVFSVFTEAVIAGNIDHCLIDDGNPNSNIVIDKMNVVSSLDQYPVFVDTTSANLDLSLQNTSPAINRGDNTFIIAGLGELFPGSPTDLFGNDRILNGLTDVGAFELQECPNIDLHFSPMDTLNQVQYIITDQAITARNTIGLAASVTYDAKICVELLAGFETEAGVTFEVKTDGCVVNF